MRLAIVGAGRMGTAHARILTNEPQFEIGAICDVREHVGSTLASEVGATFVPDLSELAKRADIDGWIVATSTNTHGRIVSVALDHRIPTLCEKPLTLDLGVSHAISERVIRERVPVQIGFWRRYAPPWAMLKASIDAGEIGDPLLLRFAQWDADPPPPAFCDPNVSGGLALDCGVHEYDLAEWLTGSKVQGVTAWPGRIVDESVGEVGDIDNLIAVLELANGSVATVELTRNVRFGDDVRTEVVGSNGAAIIEMYPQAQLRLGTKHGMNVSPGSIVADAMSAGIVAQAEAFAVAVKSGNAADIPGPQSSIRAVRIGRAIQAASSSGSRVAVDD